MHAKKRVFFSSIDGFFFSYFRYFLKFILWIYKNIENPFYHGLGARDDAAAMQYLIPDWTFDPKRPALVR